MARTVAEIMNPEVFSVRPNEPVETTRMSLTGLGISAAPVIDQAGKLIGWITLQNIERSADSAGATVADRMTKHVLSVGVTATLEKAGKQLSDNEVHHLVVVDEDRKVVGFLSALNVLRALIGEPISHPDFFPHLDNETGATWSDDMPLDLESVKSAPDGPGVWVLVHGGSGVSELTVWAEAADNVCSRLIDLLSLPQQSPELARLLKLDHLRFRASPVSDPDQRARVLNTVKARLATPGELVTNPTSSR